ncbi:MAG: hypothetical protein JNK89_03395 [Saprospiraceae bacterium]|nr:hypothetical protein [Saprospiraceae bacterium]
MPLRLVYPFSEPFRTARRPFFLLKNLAIGSGLLAAPIGTLAQQPVAASSTAQVVVPADTLPFQYVLSLHPETSYPADDTLPDADFRMYDPARRQAIDWGTLGNIGASSRPLFFQTSERLGFDAGIRPFELYQLHPEALRFYRNSRSFTDLFFSQGRVQNDNLLRARFSRTFSGGLNFSLQYRTFNHLGQFRYQAVKHSALALGVWYPAGPRYEFFLIYSRNTDKQQENGGIVTDTVFGGGQFSGPIDAEVRLPDRQALTQHGNWTVHWTQHLKFTGLGSDSPSGKRVLRASHTAEWSRQRFKFADPGNTAGGKIGADSLFFDTFFVDRRGLRQYLELHCLDNTVTLNTFKSKKPGRPSDELALGLRHKLFMLKQEPQPDSVFSNLFLTGRLQLKPSDGFRFEAQGDLGVLANFGEYRLRGALEIGLGKAGLFRASLLSQRYPPGWLSQRLYVSQRLIWSNDFSKPVETSLSASYALPVIGLEVTGSTHLVNNFLYFDQRGLAAQTGAPIQVAQLLLRENLRLGRLRFDNTVALQRANRNDVLRLPSWFTKNSLYYAGPFFRKKMHLEAGVDFRLNGSFLADGYQPLTGQFHLQDSSAAQPYPWMDVFVSFKVRTFRFFVRYENLSTFWDDQTVLYQTARYPQPFGALRFGIGWRFMDSNRDEQAAGEGGSPAGPPGRTGF